MVSVPSQETYPEPYVKAYEDTLEFFLCMAVLSGMRMLYRHSIVCNCLHCLSIEEDHHSRAYVLHVVVFIWTRLS